MYASWTYRLRFIKKHLLMFLLAFGWLLIQTQVAVASHQCSMDLRGEVATIQHMEMMAQPGPHYAAGASPLCEKHCAGSGTKRSCPAASGGAACRHDPDLNSARVLVFKPFCVVRYPSCCGAAGNDPLLPVSGVKTC